MTPSQIKKLRQEMGISLEKFASLIGVSWITAQRWEKGKHKPSQLAEKRLIDLEDFEINRRIS